MLAFAFISARSQTLSLARSFFLFLFFFLVQLNKFVVTQIFPETVSAPSSLFSLVCEVFLMFLDTCSVGGMLSIKGTQISVQCFLPSLLLRLPCKFPRYGTNEGLLSYLILRHRLTFILFICSNPQRSESLMLFNARPTKTQINWAN